MPCTPSESIQERSEAAFRAMTNAVPAIIWAGNANGDKVYLNDRWYEYTGQTIAEARGTGWTLALHPDDRAKILSYWRRCCSTGETYEGECRYRRHDGEYRWHEFRAVPYHASTEYIDFWYGVSIDVTERKKMDGLFRDDWDQLRLAWQATGDILWDRDVEDDSLRLSSTGNEIYGWLNMVDIQPSVDRLLHRIHHDDLPRIKQGLRNCLADSSSTNPGFRS